MKTGGKAKAMKGTMKQSVVMSRSNNMPKAGGKVMKAKSFPPTSKK